MVRDWLHYLANTSLVDWFARYWPELVFVCLVGASCSYVAYKLVSWAVGVPFLRTTRVTIETKLRGFAMNKRTQREREKTVREYISWQWVLAVEQAYVSGLITELERNKFTDELAFKFSDKSIFMKGRQTYIKNRLRTLRKRAKLPLTLKDAGVDPALSIDPRNIKVPEETKNVLQSMTKAA